MNTAAMTNSEILDAAQSIRASAPSDAPCVLDAEQSETLRLASQIEGERTSSGLSGLIETALAAVIGERRAAELAVEKARKREAEIEKNLADQKAIERRLEAERIALENIKRLIREYDEKTKPASEAAAMASRWEFRHDARFREHLPVAVEQITTNRHIRDALPLYMARSKDEIAKLEDELKGLRKQLKK